jgi:hypothetical protein
MLAIVGTWKLLHTRPGTQPAWRVRRLMAGRRWTAPPSPRGRMMSVVCDGRPELPAGLSREYSFYLDYSWQFRGRDRADVSDGAATHQTLL